MVAVEQRYSGKMEKMTDLAEKSNAHHHADLERAMDEMDDMRRRLIEAHEKNQAAVNARADEQIADMEREKMAMEAHYLEEIKRLEDERMTLAEAAGEIGATRRVLLQERVAYQALEQEHAEEIRSLMNERRMAEEVCHTLCFCVF